MRTVPAIYLLRGSPHGSSILPSIASHEDPRTDSPPTMVYMNLQPPDGTARRSPVCWWSLTRAFSPLPRTPEGGGGCFLLPTPTVANSFYFRKWSVLCCPDFPPACLWHAGGRAGILLSRRKVTLNGTIFKIKSTF